MCNFGSPTRSLWLSHLRSVYGEDENFSIVCQIDNCCRSYQKCSSFVSHVYRQHRGVLICNERRSTVNTALESNTAVFQHAIENISIENSNDYTELQYTVDELLHNDSLVQKRKAALYILNLKDVHGLSESAIEHIIREANSMHLHTLGRIRAKISDHLSRNSIDLDLSDVYEEVKNPFCGLDSTYLQEKFYREHFGCIVRV